MTIKTAQIDPLSHSFGLHSSDAVIIDCWRRHKYQTLVPRSCGWLYLTRLDIDFIDGDIWGLSCKNYSCLAWPLHPMSCFSLGHYNIVSRDRLADLRYEPICEYKGPTQIFFLPTIANLLEILKLFWYESLCPLNFTIAEKINRIVYTKRDLFDDFLLRLMCKLSFKPKVSFAVHQQCSDSA